MSLGASIFVSVVLLSVVLLFIATKDRWKWKKIVLFFIAGLITMCVLVGCGFWLYTQPGDGITDMGGTPLYCGDCPDAAKNADKVCEVPNGDADGLCNWTIQRSQRYPTGDPLAGNVVSFANSCDETDSLGCLDIDETNCIRITKAQCVKDEDVYAFKLLSSEGLTGDIYLQFYIKIMAPPIDVDCDWVGEGETNWTCEACGSGVPMTPGHDVELIAFTAGAKNTYGPLPSDYNANVYMGLHNHGGQLTISTFHYTTYNNHKPGNVTVSTDGSGWIGVRLHIYNSVTTGDYYEWWADWDNDGVWTSMGSTLDGYHSSYGGDHAVTDPITFAHPFRYIHIGQGDLEGDIDFQMTGIKVNTTGFPAGCTKTDTTVNELASIETPEYQ